MKSMTMENVIEVSQRFWDAMEHSDEAGMRAIADPDCQFVHIGITCGLDQEIGFYTSDAFQPTSVTFLSQVERNFGDATIVTTDCDCALPLDGEETSHHFAVTEVYIAREGAWRLVQFSFTALVY